MAQGGNIGRGLIGNLKNSASEYFNEMSPLKASLNDVIQGGPVKLKFGNFETPITTGSQRDAYGRLSDYATSGHTVRDNLAKNIGGIRQDQALLDRDTLRTKTGYDIDFADQQRGLTVEEAKIQNSIAQKYAPNTTEMNYIDILNKMNQFNENLRYGIPSTTSTAEYTQPGNILQDIANITNIGKNIFSLFAGAGG